VELSGFRTADLLTASHFASLLVQKCVSLYVVKELLGHENLATTQIYSHLKTENLFEAVNVL